MSVGTRIAIVIGMLSAPMCKAQALPDDAATERAREFFKLAVTCHDRNDFDCAIDNYLRSLREVEKPKTLVRAAWAYHEKLVVVGMASDSAKDALLCAKSFYLRALAACGDKNAFWDRKGDDCERTQSQYAKLEALGSPPRALAPAATSALASTSPPSPSPVFFSQPIFALPLAGVRDNRVAAPQLRQSAPINHAKNMQIAGIVLGTVGIAGAAAGIALSQTVPAEPISPSPFNAEYPWTMYDYIVLGSAGVAVLGGVLWLSGKLMQPRIRLVQSYPAYRYY